AGLLVGALTFTNLFVGVFNLLPGLPLDGGFVVDALVWRVTGDRSKGLLVAGWLGRALTVVVLFWIVVRPLLAGQTPSLFTIVWGGLIGAFLWSGATNAIKSATARRLISSVTVGQVLRPVLTVAATESAQGVLDRLGRDPQVGFVVAVDGSGSPAGLVDVPAIGGIDEVRRPLVAAASLVLRQPDGWLVAAGPDDDVGSVINAIATHPQSDGSQLQVVLVTDPVGRILGTVAVDDLNRAFPR
ncbi:MAG: site-2 protease family protein, partial [Lapillicoccus sp.]